MGSSLNDIDRGGIPGGHNLLSIARRMRSTKGRARAVLVGLLRPVVVAGLAMPLVVLDSSALGAVEPSEVSIECRAVTESSTVRVAGVQGVAPGERVIFESVVELGSGDLFQDVLRAPGGELYFSSFLSLRVQDLAASPGLVWDLPGATLSIGGAVVPLVPGTQPQVGAFALDTSVPGLARVYMPGDGAAMVANPDGFGEYSYTIAADTEMVVSVPAIVPQAASGTVLNGAACESGYSYTRSTNRASGVELVDVAVAGRALSVDKTPSTPLVSAGGEVLYTVAVSVPLVDADDIATTAAFDVVVDDVLPAGLVYVAGSASAGGTATAGGVTWTIPQINPGETVVLTYRAAVDAAVTVFDPPMTNTVEVTGMTAPGARPTAAVIGPVEASATVYAGAPMPSIEKSASLTRVGNGDVEYTVRLVWPATDAAGPQWHDVLVADAVPSGFEYVDGTVVCAPIACPTTSLGPVADEDGTTMIGHTAEVMGPFTAEQTWTWTYTVTSDGTGTLGQEVPRGTQLDNRASVSFNNIPRLGGAQPNLLDPYTYDQYGEVIAPVVYDRPWLELDKTAPSDPIDPSAAGIVYTITVRNVGGVAAEDVVVNDYGPRSGPDGLGSIDPATVVVLEPASGVEATYSGGQFTIDNVPAGEQVVVQYALTSSWGSTHPGPWLNRATVQSYSGADSAGTPVTYSDNQATDAASMSLLVPKLDITKTTLTGSPSGGAEGEVLTYRVTITNIGTGTAYDVAGVDFGPGVSLVTPLAGCGLQWVGDSFSLADPLAAGGTVSCDISIALDTELVAGSYLNNVEVTWADGFGSAELRGAGGGEFVDTATASFTVVDPVVTIAKGPNATDPGNVIPAGGDSTYTIRINNPSPVPASNVVLADTLPETLELRGSVVINSTTRGVLVSGSQFSIDSGGAIGDTGFEFTMFTIQPGETLTITVPVRSDGTRPADLELVNTASATIPRTGATVSDDGVLEWIPELKLPEVQKSSTPDEGEPGSTMEWEVVGLVPTQVVDLFDVTFVDSLPDGIDYAGPATYTCAGTNCANFELVELTPVPQLDGSTRLGWTVAQTGGTNTTIPFGSGALTFTITFDGSVAATYDGGGSPVAGSDTAGTRVVNTVRPYLNVEAPITPPQLSNLSDWQFKSSLTTAPFNILGPRIELAKTITNQTLVEWDDGTNTGSGYPVDVGEVIAYEVRLTNVGSGTAHNVVGTDDLALDELANLSAITASPSTGFTITEPPGSGAPGFAFAIASIPAGGEVVITYSGTSRPSSELFPGSDRDPRFSALPQSADLILNSAVVDSYATLSTGGIEYGPTEPAVAEAYVYTPVVSIRWNNCMGNAASDTMTLTVANRYPILTAPGLDSAGTGTAFDPVLTVELTSTVSPGSTTYRPGTALVNGVAATPTISTNAAGNQVLTFDLADIPMSSSVSVVFRTSTAFGNDTLGLTGEVVALDAAGDNQRGDASGATYLYRATATQDSCGGPSVGGGVALSKWPEQNDPAVVTDPDSDYDFFISVGADLDGFTNPVLTDTLPVGVTYVGPIEFNVIPVTGASISFTMQGTVVGQTITWDFALAPVSLPPLKQIYAVVPTHVEPTATTDVYLTNTATLTAAEGEWSDTGYVYVLGPNAISLEKRATNLSRPDVWDQPTELAIAPGDSVLYTVSAQIPPNVTTLFDARLLDGEVWSDSIREELLNESLVCVSGCLPTDPALIPYTPSPATFLNPYLRGYFLGDLAPSIAPRVYEWTYTIRYSSLQEWLDAGLGLNDSRQYHDNEVQLRWGDTDSASFPVTTSGSPTTPILGVSTAYTTGVLRDRDNLSIETVYPGPKLTKNCVTLSDDMTHPFYDNIGTFAEPGTANFECVIKVTYPTRSGTTIVPGTGVVYTVPVFGEVDRIEIHDFLYDNGSSWYANEPEMEFIAYNANALAMEPIAAGTTVRQQTSNTPPEAEVLVHRANGLSLAAGESFTFSYRVRLYIKDADNTLRISEYVDVPDTPDLSAFNRAQVSEVEIDGVTANPWWGYTAAQAYMRMEGGLLRLVKQGYRSSVMNELLTDQTLPTLRSTDSAQILEVGESASFSLGVAMLRPGSIQEIVIEDYLAPGLSYVAGSARIAYVDASGTTQYLPITPTGSGTVPLTGPPACDAVDGFFPNLSGYVPDGSRVLRFGFVQDGPGALNGPWALRFPGHANTYWRDDPLPPVTQDVRGSDYTDFVIVYDAVPLLDPSCVQSGGNSSTFLNIAEMQWRPAGWSGPNAWVGSDLDVATNNGSSYGSSGASEVIYPETRSQAAVNVLVTEARKTPDTGVVADGQTGVFTLELDVPGQMLNGDCENYVEIEVPHSLDGTADGVPPGPQGFFNPESSFMSACGGLFPDDYPVSPGFYGGPSGDQAGSLSGSNAYVPVTLVDPDRGGVVSATPVSLRWAISDTLVDDGNYVCGSATVESFNPWGTPVAGSALTETSCVRGTDAATGRANVTVTWVVSGLPMGVSVWSWDEQTYRYYPGRVQVHMPVPVPDGTVDGVLYPNVMESAMQFVAGGAVVASFENSDAGLLEVVNPSPPPQVTKTASVSPVAPGQVFSWNIAIPLAARTVWFDLAFTDIVPPSMEMVSVGAPVCTAADLTTPCDQPVAITALPTVGSTLSWWFGDVSAAETNRVVTIPVTVRFTGPEVDGDILRNEVSGFSNEDDLYATPSTVPTVYAYTRTDTGEVPVGEPLLVVDKVVTNLASAPFNEGDVVEWSITVTNEGTSTAFAGYLVDDPDPEVFEAVTAITTTSIRKDWTTADPRVEWALTAMAPGETRVFEVEGRVKVGVNAAGIVEGRNTALVPTYQSQPRSNLDARMYAPVVDTAVVALSGPLLTVTKMAGDCATVATTYTPTTPGDQVQWCVTVTNTGTDGADDAQLRDTLPVGWTFASMVSGASPTISMSAGSQVLSWDPLIVPAGGSLSFTYITTAAADAEAVSNRVVVRERLAATGFLPGTPTGYWAAAEAFANPLDSGLAIRKVPDTQRYRCDVGATCQVTWEIVVQNTNSTTLTNVSVVDDLPAGLSVVSTSQPAGWSAAVVGSPGSGPEGGTPIEWTIASMAAGEVASFPVTAAHVGIAGDINYLNHVTATATEVPSPVENQALATFWASSSVGNYVWADNNLDGQQGDPTVEPPVAGASVTLWRDTDGDPTTIDWSQVTADLDGVTFGTAGTITTLADGRYLFDNLLPGTYQVRFAAPEGWALTDPNVAGVPETSDSDGVRDTGSIRSGSTGPITLSSGENNTDVDQGLFALASLSGKVWSDLADNGTFEPGDITLGGVTVTLTGTESSGNTITRTTTTNLDGTYTFTGLLPGVYQVVESQPVGYTDASVLPPAGTKGGTVTANTHTTITLAAGDAATGYDFIEVQLSTISGRVWEDISWNGNYNPGLDVPISDVTITLTGTDTLGNAVMVTTTTATDGTYTFTGLRPGTYTVTESQPSGYNDGVVVPPGSLGGTPSNRAHTTITVGLNQTGANYDFPEVRDGVGFGSLPQTGSNALDILLYGGLLLTTGWTLTGIGRRKRHSTT